MRLHRSRALFVGLAAMLLAGCAAPTPAPTPMPTATVVLPTLTPYPTATAYPTFTPYPTLPPTQSPSSTPLPTATATNTPTSTPKPAAAQPAQPVAAPVGSADLWRTPGAYPFQTPQCVYYPDSFEGRYWDVTFCIIRVDVYDFGLRFYAHWKLKLTGGSFDSKRGKPMHPKSTSFAFYLVDNLGTKYPHSRMGGAADSDWPVQAPEYLMGYDDQNNRPTVPISWWEFAPARPGASSFTFVDDEHGIKVGPIVLSR